MNFEYHSVYKEFYNNDPELFFRIKDLKDLLNNFKDNDTIEFTVVKREDATNIDNVVRMHINGKSHLDINLDKDLKYCGATTYYEINNIQYYDAHNKEETNSCANDSITNEAISYEDLIKEIKELKEENNNMKKFINDIDNIIHEGTI